MMKGKAFHLPKSWPTLTVVKRMRSMRKKYRNAIALIDQAIAENSENSEFHRLKAYCHAKLEDYAGAILAIIKQAIEIDPDDAELYELLANSASFLSDVDTAVIRCTTIA
jgi:tetratricopeptide (TPR) repeat protein